jgi:endonuclease/exonuclease/phosphatase (EEP) superfamily protein YafD
MGNLRAMRSTEPDDVAVPDEDVDDPQPPERRRRLRPALHAICWLLIVVCFVFAFFRVFGLERTWFGYTIIAFTPYVAAASLLPLVLALIVWRDRIAIGAAFITSFALISVLVPRVVGHPDPVRGPTLRVMSSNMEIGGADAATIVRLVRERNIDVLALQEYTPQAHARLIAAGLMQILPYAQQTPVWGADGSGLYSRYPLSDTGATAFPGGFRQAYGTINVPGAQPVVVMSIHPVAPGDPSLIKYWHTDLSMEPPATPHGVIRLMVGDFNSTLDHALLRKLIGTGYHDAAATIGKGFVTTWPYDGTKLPKVTLDHALVDPRIGVSTFDAEKVPNTDHRSIFVTVTLPHS